MAKKRSPEVTIMNLFATLSGDGQRIVADWIRSQVTAPRKAKEKKPKTEKPKLVITDGTTNVPTLPIPICATCGNLESFADHNHESNAYHIFRASLKKKKNAVVLPDDPEKFVHGANA